MNKDKEKLISKLRNKEYRDAFVSEHINTGIPFQIQALREQRGWTQDELGKRANMVQARISLLEDPNYGRLTLSTLKKLASAFDIGLIVRFVPYSELLELELKLTNDALKALSFDEEPCFRESELEGSLLERIKDVTESKIVRVDFKSQVLRKELAEIYRSEQVRRPKSPWEGRKTQLELAIGGQ